jgi:hypothetical protein
VTRKKLICSVAVACLLAAQSPTLIAQVSAIKPDLPARMAEQTSNAGQDLPTLNADAFQELSSSSLGSGLLFALNLIRIDPELLNSDPVLRFFVLANNCANPQIEKMLNNEFELPRIATFYKSNAGRILASLPNSFEMQTDFILGAYDATNGSFPLRQPIKLTQYNPTPLGPCAGRAGNLSGNFYTYKFFGTGSGLHQVMFSPIEITQVPMTEQNARNYVNSLDNPSVKRLNLVAHLELLPTKPTITNRGNQGINVQTSGRIVNVAAYDAHGKVIATLDNMIGPASPQPLSAGPGTPPSSAHMDASPSANPVAHSGMMGSSFNREMAKCNSGDAHGCEMVGFDLEHGIGVDGNPQTAREYFKKSCDMGRKIACSHLK